MIQAIRALFTKEIEMAQTVAEIDDIKRAYLGKDGIINKMGGVLWKAHF